MMGGDQVQDNLFQLFGKRAPAANPGGGPGDDQDPLHDVAEELPSRSKPIAMVDIFDLLDLADIVQKRARNRKVTIYFPPAPASLRLRHPGD